MYCMHSVPCWRGQPCPWEQSESHQTWPCELVHPSMAEPSWHQLPVSGGGEREGEREGEGEGEGEKGRVTERVSE